MCVLKRRGLVCSCLEGCILFVIIYRRVILVFLIDSWWILNYGLYRCGIYRMWIFMLI